MQVPESLLREDPVGKPMLVEGLSTSHNTVHQAYHLLRFMHDTGTSLQDLTTIIEWGGGYGCLAKLLQRATRRRTAHVIFDISIMAALQWLYLTSTLGPEAVVLSTSGRVAPEMGKVTLIPVSLAPSIDLVGDVFVSTWALSESTDEAQDLVIERDWYGCEHLLLASQASDDEFPYASRLIDAAAQAGACVYPIDFIPGRNMYAVR